eukprot:TRINITY_DN29627_c0_g1_i1.p1 TRINITY_DN29627_c0_g1~~TRINITY_DN29627_c0_g1_i1.p1  ORF type:complete len:346 (-),score=65.12 TRINITY_DN29627_c0_g1_i1:302-1339(-)
MAFWRSCFIFFCVITPQVSAESDDSLLNQASLDADEVCQSGKDEDCSLSLLQAKAKAHEMLDDSSESELIVNGSSSILDDETLDLDIEDDEEDTDALKANASEGGPQVYSFYVYRAKDKETYADENVNMANLPGVLWYLHNEVVGHCPRKFGVTRIIRYKITMRATPELAATGKNFARLCHFDYAQCTGPESSLQDYSSYGYVVGCDKPSFKQASYPQATWYSFPGKCPEKDFKHKANCPKVGGLCKPGEAWSRTCTWKKESAGEITLDQLTHIRNFDARCKRGFAEYNLNCDCGGGSNFWRGKTNYRVGLKRERWLQYLFKRHFPQYPAKLGKEPTCPYGDPLR